MQIEGADFEDEIASFKQWLREYGPYVWVEVEDDKIREIDTSLIWSSHSIHDYDYIANCFDEDEECNGFYVATKPYAAREGTEFVTTHVNVPCEANTDCDPDCLSCGGLGYTTIDIEELSKELPMTDDQIASLFIDYWDNYRPKESDSDESHARFILDLCSLTSLQEYAKREIDQSKFSDNALDLLENGTSMTSAELLRMGWNSLAEAFSCNPNLHYKSFDEVLNWRRPTFKSVNELMDEASSKIPSEAFNLGRYSEHSKGVIESMARIFYKELLGSQLRSERFAFYGAIFSLSSQDSYDAVNLADHFGRKPKEFDQELVSWLKDEFVNQESAPFLSFIVDQINPKGLQLNKINEAQESHIQQPKDMTFSNPLLELRGIADFHPKLSPYSQDLVDYGVDAELSEDFATLENMDVLDFLDYYALYTDLDYPKAFYLMIANPFVTPDFALPELDTKTFDGEWEFYVTYNDEICTALPGDFHGIFHTVPRVLTYYSLRAVVDRTQELGQFAWDPYRSISFTRSDLYEELRTEYLKECLENLSANDVDESSPLDGTGAYDIEIACLFETSQEVHRLIFGIGSTLLNLSLLLNPSVSESLRKEIRATGLEIEFVEDFDSINDLIERANTYKDPGLARILQGVVLHLGEIDKGEELDQEFDSFIDSTLETEVRSFFGKVHQDLGTAATEAAIQMKNLYEIDEYKFVEVLEDLIYEGISKDFGYEISRSMLKLAGDDSEFVGTFFAVLSGADLIDPSVMLSVTQIDVYPFAGDGSEDFNRTKCPAASVALSPSVTSDLLEELAESEDYELQYRIALNPTANEQTLLTLVKNSLQNQLDSDCNWNEYILGTVALHRNSTEKVIKALAGSSFVSTNQAIGLRSKATSALCKVDNTDCAALSPKSVFGNSLLWWELTSMSWAIPGISCAQGLSCRLGIGDHAE
jgi:hypothetical protein